MVGSGRCGTKSLAAYYGGDHEPHQNPVVYLASAYAHGWVTAKHVAGLLVNLEWADTVADHKQSELIEITSQLWDCDYLWVVRNPADTVASLVANRWYLPGDDNYPPGFLNYHGTWDGKDAETTTYNNSGNRTRGDRVGDFTVDEWTQMSQVERCGWWWGYVNKRIAVQLDKIPTRAQVVRLEDHPELLKVNTSKVKPVSGWEPYVSEVANKLGY